MFTSKYLKAFINTAEEKSIKNAAEKLFLTPPSVCSMIKKLESQLNTRLFHYNDGAMNLTNEGRLFYEKTHQHYLALQEVAENVKNKEQYISIFVDPDIYFITDILNYFFYKQELLVKIHTTFNHHIEYDILITPQKTQLPDYSELKKIDFSFIIAHKKQQEHASKYFIQSLSFKDTSYTENVLKEIRKSYPEKNIIFEDNVGLRVQMVSAGLASSFIPKASLFGNLTELLNKQIDTDEFNFNLSSHFSVSNNTSSRSILIINKVINSIEESNSH